MIDFSKYNVLAVDDVPLNLLLVEKMVNCVATQLQFL